MENKMTDNEIKKALECCTTNGASCKDCPAFVKVDRSNCKKYFRGALDLINRQKAEIERLKAHEQMAEGYADALVEMTKAEAYKEFAERLKGKSEYGTINISPWQIDNLVKEMVGE